MIKKDLINLIQKVSGKKIKLTLDQDLISTQVLDSLSVMLLLSEIEKKIKKKINMKKFKIDNFRNLKKIDKFINNEKNS
tara:strand:+ start:8172 stop:8408 length:237 start_codon:yes stop_codon:yes gene_type:complete